MPGINDEKTIQKGDITYQNAHGVMMVLAWMTFASTAILLARYGRNLNFGSVKKIAGEAIWFQLHRIFAFVCSVLTLLGFFFILARDKAEWVAPDQGFRYIHSFLGVIVFSTTLIQIWLVVFRCDTQSPYRFVFNWLHRVVGCSGFLLSIPTLFTIAVYFENDKTAMIVILSIWTAWTITVTFLLEILRLQKQRSIFTTVNQINSNINDPISNETARPDWYCKSPGKRKETHQSLLVFSIILVHLIVSITLSIALSIVILS